MSKYLPWKNLETEVARRLRLIGFQARRLWDVQFEEGGKIDVKAQRGKLKLALQCKYGKNPRLKEAWLEANMGKEGGEIPVGIVRFREDKNTLVVMSLSDFLKLLNNSRLDKD